MVAQDKAELTLMFEMPCSLTAGLWAIWANWKWTV